MLRGEFTREGRALYYSASQNLGQAERSPASVFEAITARIAYESFSWVNRRLLPVDFSIRLIQDSTAL
jgi:hypothetical protein